MNLSPTLIAKPTILTEEQQKEIANFIYEYAKGVDTNYKTINKYWSYYNDEIDPTRFDYLTKIGDYELPSKPVHIPLQRHLIDSLVSQQARRPFSFSICSVDQESIIGKYNDKIKDIGNAYDMTIRGKVTDLLTQRQQLEMQLSKMQQIANPQPDESGQVSPEAQQQAMQVQEQLPMIQTQMSQIFEKFDAEITLSSDQLEEINVRNTYTNKDVNEDLAQKVLLKLRQTLDIEKKSTANFRVQQVTGKQYYFVDYVEGHKFPIFETVDPIKVRYPKIESVKWVQEGPWCAIEDRITMDQLEMLYGEEIRKKYGDTKMKNLGAGYSIGNRNTFVSTPGHGALYVGQNDYSYSSAEDTSQSISRWRVFFKVNQRVRIKKSPNPHIKGKSFTHFIEGSKHFLNSDEYKFSNGYYVNRTNPTDSVKVSSADE